MIVLGCGPLFSRRHPTRTSLHTLASIAALVLLALPAGAVTTVFLDFESLADGEFVTSQFAADGITFSNAVTLVAGASLNEIDFPPSSGTHVISGLGAGALTIQFSSLADSVALNIISFDHATVSYFDASNALILSNGVGPNLGFATATGTPSGLAIAKVTVANADGNANFLVLDNVIVRLDDRQTPPIPEPSAFLTMTCGLLTVAASLRRRT